MSEKNVVHIYFGDATAHTIAMNYIRSSDRRPHKILLDKPFNHKLARLVQLFFKLLGLRFREPSSLIHTHDVVSATLATFLRFKHVIFDSHEIYGSMVRKSSVRKVVSWMERFATRNAQLVIYPSKQRLEYCIKDKSINCMVIENLILPTNVMLNKSDEHTLHELRVRVESAPGRRFVYAGAVTPVRGIVEILDAFKDQRLAGDSLFLAGQKSDWLDELLEGAPESIHYLGALPHPVMVSLLNSFHAGIALYKPINANNRLAAPTKLFEFLYFDLAVIANRSPYVEEVVQRLKLDNVHLADEVTSEDIVNACLAVSKEKTSISEFASRGVSWLSQLPQIEQMYMSVENNQPVRDMATLS